MYEIKPNIIKPQELCILTNPKQHGVVNMYQKDQPICSESIIDDLQSTISHLESIYTSFIKACEINDNTYDIMHDEDNASFPGLNIFSVLDKLDDLIGSNIDRIKNSPGQYQMTKNELSNCFDEYGEPENQSPFGAGTPSREDLMGDI